MINLTKTEKVYLCILYVAHKLLNGHKRGDMTYKQWMNI